jgi:hypothetical protein
VNQVGQDDSMNQSTDSEDVFIGAVSKNDGHKIDKFTCTLYLNNRPISCKLDTGADLNLISKSVLLKYMKPNMMNLNKSKIRAKSYGGFKVKILGKIQLECRYKQKFHVLEFHVVDHEGPTLIGADSCDEMGFIKRVNVVHVKEEKQESEDSHLKSAFDILQKNADLFQGVGCIKNVMHHISIDKNVTPVIHPPRKVAVKLRPKVKDELDRLEKLGIIDKVNDPTDWVNSMVVVNKPKVNQVRLCVDPKDLNKAVKREHYPMKNIEDILPKLSGAQYFTVLDAKNGFWSIRLDEESSELCTFNTPYGRYKFNRLPMGLKSAPEVYQKVMTQLFDDIDGCDVIVDDILIWGSSLEEHNSRLTKVLDRARERGVRFNDSKKQVCKDKVAYLGHVVSKDGVVADKKKIDAVCEMPPPTDVAGVQRLLGMVTYLAKFIPNLSDLTAPLRECLNTEVEWHWGKIQQDSFEKLKEVLTSTPVLRFFDVNLPVTLSVDASSKAVGFCLLQKNGPVAYGSKALSSSQQNYAQIEKEMYAIVAACEKFHDYIFGQDVIYVESDHKPLEIIFKKPLYQAPQRLQSMLLQIQKYPLSVGYKPGSELYVADTLSRAYPVNVEGNVKSECTYEVNMFEIVPVSESKYQQLKIETENDAQLQELSKQVHQGWPDTKAECKTLIHPFWNIRDLITEVDGVLYKSDKIIVPKSMQQEMLNLIHRSHMGMQKCKSRARLCLYWPNMCSQIENVVSSCSICQDVRAKNSSEPLKSHEIPDRPWAKVGCDLFQYKARDYLVCVDYYSKYPEIQLLSGKTAKQCISALKSIFARHGIPQVVFSDNGPCFSCREFKEFANEWGFNQKTSSPLYPQSNGQAENCVKLVKNLMRKAEKSNTDPLIALLEYRVTPIDGINVSPSQLLFSRELRTFLPTTADRLKPKVVYDAHQGLKNRQLKQKYFHDRKYSRNLKQLSEGDVVRMQLNNQWKPAVVEGKFEDSSRSYVVRSPEGDMFRRNRKHLIKTNESRPLPDFELGDCNESENVMPDNVPVVPEHVPVAAEHVPNVPEVVPTTVRTNVYDGPRTRLRAGVKINKPKRYR